MLAAWSRRKFSAAIRASVSLRSSVTTRRKRRLRKSASTPSPQVRSSAVSPSIRLCAAHASLDACSKASGGSMHCAAAYDGSFDAARARYLTCVATSRAWGTVRSRATSSGSRPRETAMARCTSSVSSSSYSSGVIMRANVRFFFGSADHAATVASVKKEVNGRRRPSAEGVFRRSAGQIRRDARQRVGVLRPCATTRIRMPGPPIRPAAASRARRPAPRRFRAGSLPD